MIKCPFCGKETSENEILLRDRHSFCGKDCFIEIVGGKKCWVCGEDTITHWKSIF